MKPVRTDHNPLEARLLNVMRSRRNTRAQSSCISTVGKDSLQYDQLILTGANRLVYITPTNVQRFCSKCCVHIVHNLSCKTRRWVYTRVNAHLIRKLFASLIDPWLVESGRCCFCWDFFHGFVDNVFEFWPDFICCWLITVCKFVAKRDYVLM